MSVTSSPADCIEVALPPSSSVARNEGVLVAVLAASHAAVDNADSLAGHSPDWLVRMEK
jgi:hypothetical protein